MTIQNITSKIVSTLGNKESLIPIILKDGVDSASLTYKSYKEGGIVEGKDRAIDEFGTQAIWVGGIPFYKKLIDWSAYKAAKINPGVDIRVITNKEYGQWAKDNAQGLMTNSKTQTVEEAITDCLKDTGSKAKNLYKGKVLAATALTLATYFLLTKAKQKNTKDTVIKNMNKEVTNTDIYSIKAPAVFQDFDIKQQNNKPSFKGFAKNISDAILFNPVHNMKIIDAGITTERLACSRNKTELAEHAIKEGGFLFFLYGFGNLIEKGINKFSNNVLKKPIDLSIDVLADNNFSNALKSGQIEQDLQELTKCNTLTNKLDFLKNNPQNSLVQAAKKSKIISTIKDSDIIDTSKYIDMKNIDKLAIDMKNINERFINSGESVKRFVKKTKGLKIVSVAANIGISCLFLGYIIPKAVYKYREIKTGTTKFHVEKDIREGKNK